MYQRGHGLDLADIPEWEWNAPSFGDFAPGEGLSTFTRTNPIAIDAVYHAGGTHESDWFNPSDVGDWTGADLGGMATDAGGVDIEGGLGHIGSYQGATRANARGLGPESSWFGGFPILGATIIAIGVWIAHKLWSERKGDGHVADRRYGWTPFLIEPFFIVAGIWFWIMIFMVGSYYNIPGANLGVAFFGGGKG